MKTVKRHPSRSRHVVIRQVLIEKFYNLFDVHVFLSSRRRIIIYCSYVYLYCIAHYVNESRQTISLYRRLYEKPFPRSYNVVATLLTTYSATGKISIVGGWQIEYVRSVYVRIARRLIYVTGTYGNTSTANIIIVFVNKSRRHLIQLEK